MTQGVIPEVADCIAMSLKELIGGGGFMAKLGVTVSFCPGVPLI